MTCAIHKNLRNKGLKGCTDYECLSAGQKVAQVNAAKGDLHTKLPMMIVRPSYWLK